MTTSDFFEAVKGYGELTHDEIMSLTDGKPIIIDGKEVDSILDDDGLKFSYINEDGVAYSRALSLSEINEKTLNKIYKFLCENRDTNRDFFNGLQTNKTMRRIAIIDHSTHELMVEDIDEQELQENYDGDEQKYIDDNYTFGGDYSWDWITSTQYFPEDDKTPVDVEFTDWL